MQYEYAARAGGRRVIGFFTSSQLQVFKVSQSVSCRCGESALGRAPLLTNEEELPAAIFDGWLKKEKALVFLNAGRGLRALETICTAPVYCGLKQTRIET